MRTDQLSGHKANQETYCKEFYKCPACGYEDHDAWELELSDGERIETECPNCGAKLVVSAEIVTWYKTELKEEQNE